jgi:hypothetical protein
LSSISVLPTCMKRSASLAGPCTKLYIVHCKAMSFKTSSQAISMTSRKTGVLVLFTAFSKTTIHMERHWHLICCHHWKFFSTVSVPVTIFLLNFCCLLYNSDALFCQVRAFNVHGVSPFSLVQYQKTEPKEEKKESIITKVRATGRCLNTSGLVKKTG